MEVPPDAYRHDMGHDPALVAHAQLPADLAASTVGESGSSQVGAVGGVSTSCSMFSWDPFLSSRGQYFFFRSLTSSFSFSFFFLSPSLSLLLSFSLPTPLNPVLRPITYAGWVTKLGYNVSSWRRRWAVLQGSSITYYHARPRPEVHFSFLKKMLFTFFSLFLLSLFFYICVCVCVCVCLSTIFSSSYPASYGRCKSLLFSLSLYVSLSLCLSLSLTLPLPPSPSYSPSSSLSFSLSLSLLVDPHASQGIAVPHFFPRGWLCGADTSVTRSRGQVRMHERRGEKRKTGGKRGQKGGCSTFFLSLLRAYLPSSLSLLSLLPSLFSCTLSSFSPSALCILFFRFFGMKALLMLVRWRGENRSSGLGRAIACACEMP